MFNFDEIELHILLEIKRLNDENEILESWIREGKEEPRCCVCGKLVKGLSLQRMLRPFIWCSRKCLEWKPKKIIILERRYKMDILDILKLTSKQFGGLRPQVDALNLSVPYFVSVVKKYSNEEYNTFMANNTVGERRKGCILRAKRTRKN